MDEAQNGLGPSTFPRRTRKLSSQSLPHVSTATPPHQHYTRMLNSPDSVTSRNGFAEPESAVPDILAPVPRRHLLHTSQSPRWLREPSVSPVSSRPTSPLSRSAKRRTAGSQLSFSSIAAGSAGGDKLRRMRSAEKDDTGAAMGRRWIRWMHKYNMKNWVVLAAILVSTWVKWCIGLASYSGWNTPPMYGDYEAQRHWMELTIHLPIRQWYTYDLQYWGLDYPPLTAYVSWLCGVVGSRIEPTWFALDASRGIETGSSKIFMRASVVVLDALIYVPALLMFTRTWQETRSRRTQNLALITLLMQPALLLVDFGHFQYNSVMLGFTLLAINFFAVGRDLLGAVCFVLSLGFKQMALYYAPAIGSYLLAKCILLGPKAGPKLFVRLGLVTVFSFLLLFHPWLPPFAPAPAILDPITRIFPFGRGLFEDKVANFWCASNVVVKWRRWASPTLLVRSSAALTALGFAPSVLGLLQAGWKMRGAEAGASVLLPLLPYALLGSSASFFLFSFQVHEKTILLPLLPITLLLSGSAQDSPAFGWGVLVNNVAVFSMWPLLRRDGLAVQYIATLLMWNRLIGYNPFRLPRRSFIQLLSIAVYAAALSLHVLEFIALPPARYPDLFPVLNVLISTPVFGLAWLWSIKCGIQVNWALGGLGSLHPAPSSPTDGAPSKRPESQSIRVTKGAGLTTGREGGSRTMSLGFAHARQRAPFRPASVGPDQMLRS